LWFRRSALTGGEEPLDFLVAGAIDDGCGSGRLGTREV
jgi:hypothetical protein